VLPVVDVTGTTKKITTNQILGSGGTATLASATISGDLTVDTSTLKVDSTNNRVGIGTASPLGPFHVVASAAGFSDVGYFENSQAAAANVGPRASLLGVGSVAMATVESGWNGAANTDAYLIIRTRGSGAVTERYRIASDGVATWSNVGGVAGTAMTLNATGLGVGGIPVNPLTAYGAAIAKAPVLFLTNVGSPGDYGWDFSVDGAVNGNLFIRRVNAYTKNDVLEFDRANGNLIMTPSTTATALTVNGQLTFNATSNTNLRFSYRGSDGTTRVANITLA